MAVVYGLGYPLSIPRNFIYLLLIKKKYSLWLKGWFDAGTWLVHCSSEGMNIEAGSEKINCDEGRTNSITQSSQRR